MKPNLTLGMKLALVLGLMITDTFAQTYTYKIVQQGNGKVGRPFSALTISGTRAVGSAQFPRNGLYLGQLSGLIFTSQCCNSQAPMTLDSTGNLYGEDQSSAQFYGRIFMVHPGHIWKETDLYDFSGGSDGRVPNFLPDAPLLESPVTIDSLDNLWGMTYGGGSFPAAM